MGLVYLRRDDEKTIREELAERIKNKPLEKHTLTQILHERIHNIDWRNE